MLILCITCLLLGVSLSSGASGNCTSAMTVANCMGCVVRRGKEVCVECIENYLPDSITAITTCTKYTGTVKNCGTTTDGVACTGCPEGPYLPNAVDLNSSHFTICHVYYGPTKGCAVASSPTVCLACQKGFFVSLDKTVCEAPQVVTVFFLAIVLILLLGGFLGSKYAKKREKAKLAAKQKQVAPPPRPRIA